MNRGSFAVAFVLFGVGLLTAGCGPEGPKVVPAKGKITQGGKALAGASITALYSDGNSATAVSNHDGEFALTYLNRTGAVPAKNLKMAVQKVDSSDSQIAVKATSASGEPTREAIDKIRAEADKMMKDRMIAEQDAKFAIQHVLDTKYANPATSGLELTISPEGSEELKIELP